MIEAEVTDIRPKILEKLAAEFVQRWIKAEKEGTQSENAAARWLYSQVEKHEYHRIKELIAVEFERNGYIIPGRHID